MHRGTRRAEEEAGEKRLMVGKLRMMHEIPHQGD